MIDSSGNFRIIDHQDARIGAASYDLVSLLSRQNHGSSVSGVAS